MDGRVIAFEGIDGSGKGVQIREIAGRLNGLGSTGSGFSGVLRFFWKRDREDAVRRTGCAGGCGGSQIHEPVVCAGQA